MKPCLVRKENVINDAMMIANEVTKPVTEVQSFTDIRKFQFLKDVNAIWKFCFLHSTVG